MKAELVLESQNSRHQYGLPIPCQLLFMERKKGNGTLRFTVWVDIDDVEIETFVNLEHYLADFGITIKSIEYAD